MTTMTNAVGYCFFIRRRMSLLCAAHTNPVNTSTTTMPPRIMLKGLRNLECEKMREPGSAVVGAGREDQKGKEEQIRCWVLTRHSISTGSFNPHNPMREMLLIYFSNEESEAQRRENGGAKIHTWVVWLPPKRSVRLIRVHHFQRLPPLPPLAPNPYMAFIASVKHHK